MCSSRKYFDGESEATLFTHDHLNRRAIYYSQDPSRMTNIIAPVSSFLKTRPIGDDQSQTWMRRELESLLGISDVDFVMHLVNHILKETKMDEKTRRKLVEALDPFLKPHSELFVSELFSFLSSGLNVRGYDAFLKKGS